MSYTVGRIKDEVLNLMREKSNAGDIDVGDNVADYFISVPPLINMHQKTVARSCSKIKKIFEIAQNMPDNLLGTRTWNGEETHETIAIDNDETFSSIGAQAYSFQVAGTATIFIEEETATDVWTILDTINHVSTTGQGYVSYNGAIGAVDLDNDVRIRFSGIYRYPYRWVALFADLFPTADLPIYEPYVPYDLPVDFYQKNKVEWKHEMEQFEGYSDFRFDTHSGSSKRIFLYYFDKGEFRINYYAYPIVVPDLDPGNQNYPNEQDDFVLDLPDEACPALVMLIASNLKHDEDPGMSMNFKNDAYIELNDIQITDTSDQSSTSVINTYGW
jgi:hypothetical protein